MNTMYFVFISISIGGLFIFIHIAANGKVDYAIIRIVVASIIIIFLVLLYTPAVFFSISGYISVLLSFPFRCMSISVVVDVVSLIIIRFIGISIGGFVALCVHPPPLFPF